MHIVKERLLSLLEFAQQATRLRYNPVATVTQHGIFALYEHQLQGLPGIRLDVEVADSEDETWLIIDRLHETKPPEIKNSTLRPWVEMTQGPIDEPKLKATTDGASLIEAGTHRSTFKTNLSEEEKARPPIDPQETIIFESYEHKNVITAHLKTYLETMWRPWAEAEKIRRRAIRLYSEIFTLKQRLEGSIVESQLELVWGTGIGIWNHNDTIVGYPLITHLAELVINPETSAIEIRPRNVEARIEVDWYASEDNPGVVDLEKAAKEFFGEEKNTFSPFDRGTYEPLLRTAATHLDSNGVYWPDEVPPEDRTLPKPDSKLRVTDTWVLFARPRTSNLFIQDIENLKKVVQTIEDPKNFPGPAAAIVTDPETKNKHVDLPEFRGVSAINHPTGDGNPGRGKLQDLYFPKPFNEEQVRIVQLLEVSDGVVVQGPPGTGKTHTIANVICHYLAHGKRILVTSMKEPALKVLRNLLPEELRPLAISLLTNEMEGMKQFEFSIRKIASETLVLDRRATDKAIKHLEETIDALHARLASIDRKIGEWAKKNLTKIMLDGEDIDPQDAAREVAGREESFEWIHDALNVGPEFVPQFSNSDVMKLREARRVLGSDIGYLGASLPQLIEFPESKTLVQVHQDLSHFEVLKSEIESGKVPTLADPGQEMLASAHDLLAHIEHLQKLRDEISQAGVTWTAAMRSRLRKGGIDDLLKMITTLGDELEGTMETRKAFIPRPVQVPVGMETDAELLEAVANLSKGKMPFGIAGLLGKSEQKKRMSEVRVVGDLPKKADDWRYVLNYLHLLRHLRELALRWNTLANELGMGEVLGTEPQHGVAAAQAFELYRKVRLTVTVEKKLVEEAARIFPSWLDVRDVSDNAKRFYELKSNLNHHLTKSRLTDVWTTKERFQKVLNGRNGPIIDNIQKFLAVTLGNISVTDAEMQAKWSALMAELSRVLGLSINLATVSEVCSKIESSGAPRYANLLKKPLEGVVDGLLPDNWRLAWRLKRLSTHLESIDAHHDLKKLSAARTEVEDDLSRSYSDIVVKCTWLELTKKASPKIQAALQAYLNAIQKIGKGKGKKRTVRYRQDARDAAAEANPSVPCWIMPHYRVSESLPPELECFDLVIVDEASQSDLTALPALLRAKKVLIVGDDKQVSPEGVGLEEDKIRNLMNRFLGNQVVTYRPQMAPERSIYDLFKVVFAKNGVMLKEHFRCTGPIIEYSKREFYNHELRPLRVPKASERLDPPLIDVLVEDGYRNGDINLPEMRFIVDEIKSIALDPKMERRSIGVVSLLGNKQAFQVWERLTDELGVELIERHKITCGDARTFQGMERDIMFLSMVSAPNDIGAVLARDTFVQRFNVAASRARDRMYLVRSVDSDNLSEADSLRRGLISHFRTPYNQDEARVEDQRKLCESPFELEVYDELTQHGFCVTPQVRVNQYRIDLVVEGHGDNRLAVECDGDKYHGPDKWSDDMLRQQVLKRAGWIFWRCFASTFIRRRKAMVADLLKTLAERGIEPIGAEGAPRSVHTEHRQYRSPV